ncbi:ribose-phosphate pyrophosphokinase [Bacteroidetes bacterium UKL13-3]|jgi:ribose-phosphate pyrophosphokinase|nr:ribose-phosphate pyrophosphokinase [Bacteroidetes bacterium UKL13-3]HCP94429.1 ribose-phosphate pyrophosphokinase [Bacteroidota bacterium]
MTSLRNEVKLFSGRNSLFVAEKIASAYGKPLGDITVSQFADGEIQPSINESVRGADVFFIQSTFPSADNLLELLLMIDAAKRASAHYITAVIPYFGMARQDRKDRPRVSIGSKVAADMLKAVGVSRVMTMDLHAPQIQGFFEVPVDHLDSSVIFIPWIRNLNESNLILASPDMGSSNRTRTFARALNLDMVICDKERKRANEIASMTLIGDVAGKDVILIDDIIDTGNTLAKSAQMLKDKGALSVRAMCTHPVLSGKAYETIENSVIDELVVCDTIPLKRETSKIKVLSVADLFAKAIRNVTEFESISSLFNTGVK